jgi:hypothetical protein
VHGTGHAQVPPPPLLQLLLLGLDNERATGFAPNDLKKRDIDTVLMNIKKQSRVKKYEE